jgi:8-oxo-dGTP pyrophosphatase MutT (NUDIX family)
MTWRPDLTVATIVQRDDRFLVVEERIATQLVFNQPAGHVEDGESIIEAAIRETLEETAWRFRPSHLVGTYLWRNPANGRSTLRFAIAGEVESHDPARRLDHGILRTHWLSRGELAAAGDRLRSPLVLQCIDDHLAGRRFELSAMQFIDPVRASRSAPD